MRKLVLVLAVGAATTVGCDTDPPTRFEQAGHPSSEAHPRNGTAYAPCGTPLAEVDDVWAYSNGGFTGTGTSCRGKSPVGAYEFQCVEYAQRYMHERFGLQALWPVEAAKQMCDPNHMPAGVIGHGAGYTPVRGDLAVWSDGTWGHVAVVADVYADGIAIVEQNSSAEGRRVLHGDPWGGYFSAWGTKPSCFVHAEDNDEAAPAAGDVAPSGAQCEALGYAGECRGSTSVWAEGGTCRVRDCAGEGRACGLISDAVGWGCLGGNDGSSAFDCGTLDYEGACLADDTLVWVESGACKVAHCPDMGRGCGWAGAIGYDCI